MEEVWNRFWRPTIRSPGAGHTALTVRPGRCTLRISIAQEKSEGLQLLCTCLDR
jgi:hypothetical protein